MLTRDQILAATTIPREQVDIPELGGTVVVRGMTGVERATWEDKLIIGKGRHRRVNIRMARQLLVIYCTVDDSGSRIFSEDDAEPLGQIRSDVLDRIYSVAARLSGITEEDVEELGNPSSGSRSSNSSSPSHSS